MVDANGRRGGLVVMWNEDSEVDIQIFSLNHVNMLIKMKGMDKVCFTRQIPCFFKLAKQGLVFSIGLDLPNTFGP